MASRDSPCALAGLEHRAHARSGLFKKRHLRRVENLDAVLLQDFLDLGRDVGVLAQNQPRVAVDDGHARAEPAEHLAELQADIAAPDDDALAFQLARAAAFELHDDAPCVLESGLAENEFEVSGFLKRLLAGIAEALDHAALAIDHPAHVHHDAAGVDAVVFCAPGEIRNPTARDHRFGRGAAYVDASAADVLALDHRDLPAGAGERERKRLARLASTDDYCVVCGIAHAASGENGKGSRGPAALARANCRRSV